METREAAGRRKHSTTLNLSAYQSYSWTHEIIIHRVGEAVGGGSTAHTDCSVPHGRQHFLSAGRLRGEIRLNVNIWYREAHHVSHDL